jgi:hypothetical protein
MPEEGCESNSIIAYRKYVWEMKDFQIVEEKHRLRINLWFILLDFNWITKFDNGKYPFWVCLKHKTFGDSTLGCAYCGKIKNNIFEKIILPVVYLYRRIKHRIKKGTKC